MPIISRTLDYVNLQRNGSVRVQERLIDGKGRPWLHTYLIGSEAEAIARMNARDLTNQLNDVDFEELVVWVIEKNDPSNFDFIDRDLTLSVGEERLLVRFAEQQGSKAIFLAWWIESLNPPSYTAIRIRAGFDSVAGSRIQDRAIAMAAAESSFESVEEVE